MGVALVVLAEGVAAGDVGVLVGGDGVSTSILSVFLPPILTSSVCTRMLA